MTPAIKSMLNGMNSMIAGFEKMETASGSAIDTKTLSYARSEMAKASASFQQFEKAVNEAGNEQKKFNSTASASTSSITGLVTKVGALAASYATLQGAQKLIDLSDTYSQTTARLSIMNDGLQTQQELQDKILSSANESHASYQATADMVSKLGLMAGDAFSNNDEIIDFAEQVSKQFVISGAGASESSNAMLQLTQAMASGVLRGDELNSIFENAPTLIQSIADYLEVPIGSIRKMASDGEITADTIKKAMAKTAASTDEKFEAMGMTFGQAWTVFQNKSGRAFQGVFEDLGQLANSQALDTFLNGLAGGVEMIGGVVETVSDTVSWFAAQPFMQELSIDVTTNLSDFSNGASEAFQAFKEKIEQDAPTISANFSGMKDSWDGFYQTISGDLDGWDWGEFGTGVAKIVEGWVQVETGVYGLVASLKTSFTETGDFWFNLLAVGDLEASKESLEGYVRSIADTVKNFAAIFIGQEKASDMVGDYWLNFGQETGEFLDTAMGQANSAAMSSAISVGSNIANGLSSQGPQVQQATIGLTANISNSMFGIENSALQHGQLAGGNYAAGLIGTEPTVSASAMTLKDAINTQIDPITGEMATKGESVGLELSGSIDSATGSVQKSSSNVVATIGKAFAPLPDDTRSIADYTMLGLKQGIDNSGAVGQSVTNVVDLMVNKFKTGLGIHSPSTVAEDIGYNTMLGLLNGLGGEDLLAFCNSIVADIQAAFEAGNFNLQVGTEFLGDGAKEFFQSIGVGGATVEGLIKPVDGAVTSGFGWRDPFMTDSGEMSSSYHGGLDIGAAYGTPVGAAGAGEVTTAGWHGGYGNTVIIDHGNGLESMYGHLSAILVGLHDMVTAGQTIGLVGSTGNSTGPHLHFGIYQDGSPIDPSALYGYSSGTMSARSGLHLVGENGPELLGFGGGETVLNSKKTKNLLDYSRSGSKPGGYAGGDIHISMGDFIINNDMDAKRVGQIVANEIQDALTRRPA